MITRFVVSALLYICTVCPVLAEDYRAKSGGCPTITTHTPRADVDYQAGKDAQGWAVAPADITPPALTKEDFDQVQVPLEIPLGNYVRQGQIRPQQGNIPAQNTYNADISRTGVWPGGITVDASKPNGAVKFNGKDVTSPDIGELNPDCWE